MVINMQLIWSIFMPSKLTCCRVCGLDYIDFYPWGESNDDPSNGICDCCGVEFGYEDADPETVESYRNDWIKKGSLWFNPKYKPEGWKLEVQLLNILNK